MPTQPEKLLTDIKKEGMLGKTDKTDKKQKQKHLLLVLASPPPLFVPLAGLEGDLQDFVPQAVPVQAVDRHGSFLVVCHCNKAKAFALIGVKISDHFHIQDCAERAKHLPQHGLVSFLAQVVDEDAPTRGWAPRGPTPSAHVVGAHWRKPGHTKY